MREKITFTVLLLMLAGLGLGLGMRHRVEHEGPLAEPAGSSSALASASASGAPASSSGKPVDKEQPLLDRPLRVAGLGWDLIAPGVVANDGLEVTKKGEFAKHELSVALRVADEMKELEAMLARGGADKEGADIAIVPLPEFIASFERLRALNPVIFFVTGWDRGRENLSSKLPSLSDVAAKSDVKLAGTAGDSATLLGLFALSRSGVPADKVEITSPGEPDKATLLAINKATAKDDPGQKWNLLLGSGDASRLLPFVAVAQQSLVDEHREALVTWVQVWLNAQKKVNADATASARRIGKIKDTPEPLALLSRLGEIAPVGLRENAELFALSGRGAVTLTSLFGETFDLWKSSKLLSTPPPEYAPISGRVVASLVRSEPALAKEAPDSRIERKPKAGKPRVMLVQRFSGAKLDEDAVINGTGLLAGVFHRSAIALTVHRGGAKASAALVERVVERFGLPAERVSVGKAAAKSNAAATVEVLEVQ